MINKREVQTEMIIDNFIKSVENKKDCDYTYLEIYAAIVDLYELYNHYKGRCLMYGNDSK